MTKQPAHEFLSLILDAHGRNHAYTLRFSRAKPITDQPSNSSKKIVAKPFKKGTDVCLSWTIQDGRSNVTQTILHNDIKKHLEDAIPQWYNGDLSIISPSGTQSFAYRVSNQGLESLIKHKLNPNLKDSIKSPVEQPSHELSHDRIKNRKISPKSPWIKALGLGDGTGLIYPSMQDKYKQVDKFVEIFEGLLESTELQGPLNLVDMGSGNGYITFALHGFLNEGPWKGSMVRGVEIREDLVTQTNERSEALGWGESLRFEQGSIQDFSTMPNPQVVLALHACDTATDDAIIKGIQGKARIIICSPCCHKDLRKHFRGVEEDKAITKHGILQERLAEILTDTIRSLILEGYGYKAKVFEFVAKEHSGKNLMITAVLKNPAYFDPSKIREAQDLCKRFGVDGQALLDQILRIETRF